MELEIFQLQKNSFRNLWYWKSNFFLQSKSDADVPNKFRYDKGYFTRNL